MVDVPRHLEPSDAERLHTFLARMTPGGAGGQSRAVGPILSRVQARASVAGAGEEDTLDAIGFQIDRFSITGTATSTFQLTFDPIDDSWNPTLNGQMLGEDDYSVSGQTLTITTPADLFLGADTQGSPWELRVEYAYLAGVPTAPTNQITSTSNSDGYSFVQNQSHTLPTDINAGDLLVLVVHRGNTTGTTVPASPTGGPAGWSLAADLGQASSTRASRLAVYTKTADGSEGGTAVTVTFGESYNTASIAVAYTPFSSIQDTDTKIQGGVDTISFPTSMATGAATGVCIAGSAIGGQFSTSTTWTGATEELAVTDGGNLAVSVAEFTMSGAGSSPAVTAARSANNTNGAWTVAQIVFGAA